MNFRIPKMFFWRWTILLFATPSLHASTLTGDLEPLSSGTNIDLSAPAFLDWAHWGLDDAGSFNQKAAVSSQIGNFSLIGTNPVERADAAAVAFTWNDGSPISSASNTTTAVFVTGLGNGFQLVVPADIETRKLRLFVGANGAQGQLEATLSDSSAGPFINSALNGDAGNTNGIFTLDFSAASPGQTLTVKWTALNIYDSVSGHVSLHAATFGTNLLPQIAITHPTNNAIYFESQDVTIGTDAADADGNVAQVDFFADGSYLGTATEAPFQFTWNNLLAGNYVLTAVATDNDGAAATSEPVNLFVSTNLPPEVSIVSPTNESAFLASGSIVISAAASDPNGTIAKVEFFADDGKIGEVPGAGPHQFSWTNVPAGIYFLTARATDNGGATRVSLPVEVFITTTGGVMSAQFAESASEVNLTSEGVSDWTHWGRFTENSFNRKKGVTPQISDAEVLGSGTAYQFADNFTGYSWSDGTPIAAATNTTTGIYAVGVNNGFEITVPASTNSQTLKLYLGSFAARGKLRAVLSDLSAPVSLDASINNFGNGPNGVYSIQFAAASPGKFLTVRYTVAESYNFFGNVTLQAAALDSGNAPPHVALSAPTNNAVFFAPTNIVLEATASDPDGTIAKVEFFQGATKVGERTASPYTLTLSNAVGGNYVFSAKATDNQGATFTSLPINAFVVVPGGFLAGSFSTPSGSVNLTTEGATDWKHWGLINRLTVNRKAAVVSRISDYVRIGPTRGERYTDNPHAYQWTDGTPTLNVAGTTTGLYITGLGNGFQITVPADTTLRRLQVFVGVYRGQGRIEATLNDFSAPGFIDHSLVNFNSKSGVYTIYYAAATAGKQLTIKYTAETLLDELYGNVALQAATLSGFPKPTLSITGDAAPTLHVPTESQLNYTIQFTDSLSPTNWQTLSNFLGTGGIISVPEPEAGWPSRFYRVRLNY